MDCTLKLVTDHPDKARREIRVVVEMTAQEALEITSASRWAPIRAMEAGIAPFVPRLREAVKGAHTYPPGTRLKVKTGDASQVLLVCQSEKDTNPTERTVVYLPTGMIMKRPVWVLDEFWEVVA